MLIAVVVDKLDGCRHVGAVDGVDRHVGDLHGLSSVHCVRLRTRS